MSSDRVPVGPFQDPVRRARDRGELAIVARNSGLVYHRGPRPCGRSAGVQADSGALLRAVGLKPTPCRKRGRYYAYTNRTIGYDLALRIADALNLDPVEVGI